MDTVIAARELFVKEKGGGPVETFRLAVYAPTAAPNPEEGTLHTCRVLYGPADDPIEHDVPGEDAIAALENALAFVDFFARSLAKENEVRLASGEVPYSEVPGVFSRDFRAGLAGKLKPGAN